MDLNCSFESNFLSSLHWFVPSKHPLTIIANIGIFQPITFVPIADHYHRGDGVSLFRLSSSCLSSLLLFRYLVRLASSLGPCRAPARS